MTSLRVLLMVVIAALPLAGAAQAPSSVVLRVKATRPGPGLSTTEITTVSGQVIILNDLDIDGTATVTIAPSRTSVTPTDIRAKCAKDWPDDFSMRASCEKQQQTAASTLSGRSMTTADQQTIRRKCTADWPDDFRMRNSCEERQLEALGTLGR